jgi:hypothetical protein
MLKKKKNLLALMIQRMLKNIETKSIRHAEKDAVRKSKAGHC